MNLQERLTLDLHTAIKFQDAEAKSLLRVIIGDFSRMGTPENNYGKNLSDDEIIRLLKKFKEEAVEMKNDTEVYILDQYLPKMLDETELTDAIKEIITSNGLSGMKDMGKVMGELKSKYGSNYDGKLASQIVKNSL